MKILLIEDNNADAVLISEALIDAKVNHSLYHFLDGENIINKIYLVKPDLILLTQ